MNSSLIKVAASSLAIGASIAGFSPMLQDAVSNEADAQSADAARAGSEAAAAARGALDAGDAARAIAHAEQAVEAQPRSAEYRHLLGRAYLAAGRMASAETSFQDALTINPALDRTAFNLALVQIAQGRKADAREELAALAGRVGASDLGLAYALAGDTDRAIAVLTEAVRADAGNSKARQNLALSYGLAGRWAEARVTAAQDVSMADLDQRMREWAQFANPANSWDQVASLLGVSVNPGDPGQPMRLALAPAAPVEVMTAEAPVEEDPVVAFAAPVATQSYGDSHANADPYVHAQPVPEPQTIEGERGIARVSGTVPSEFIVEEEQRFFAADEAPAPVPIAAPAAPAPRVHRDPAPAPVVHRDPPAAPRVARAEAPRRAPAPAPRDGDGRYMVQIGAYAREQNVERGWDEAVRRYAALADFEPNRADYDAGQRLYRLAFGGYDSRDAAASMCRTLRSNGVECFVRARAGDMPLQMAIRAAREAQRTAAAHREEGPQYSAVQVDREQREDPVRRTDAENGVLPLEFASDVLVQIAQLV